MFTCKVGMKMPNLRRSLGRRLRAARNGVSFDREAFAKELDMKLADYDRIEQGRADPPLDALVHAAKITGKSLDFLLTGRQFRRPNAILMALSVGAVLLDL